MFLPFSAVFCRVNVRFCPVLSDVTDGVTLGVMSRVTGGVTAWAGSPALVATRATAPIIAVFAVHKKGRPRVFRHFRHP